MFSFTALAHQEGHGTENVMEWTINNKNVEASFLTFKNGLVLLETKTGEVLIQELSSFSKENQLFIEKKNIEIKKINEFSNNSIIANKKVHWSDNPMLKKGVLSGFLLMFVFSLFVLKRRERLIASTALTSLFILILLACKTDNSTGDESMSTSVPANDLARLEAVFGQFSDVSTSSDDTYFYVSSTGTPEHNMMEGITNWQQQVPIPQIYTGNNSWSIPIQPVLAETPLLASEHFMRGAMAIAVNGVPIFNPLNNRGDDALAVGELDDWGGHCGKADDYHYHIPPTHLESVVGTDQPLAYALDGFPIYGETTDELDEYLGRFNEDGSYQYHTTTTAPYFMAGMRGVVSLDTNTGAPEDQIIPQALSTPLRGGDYGPLNGAEITNFSSLGTNSFSLEYVIGNETLYTNYSWDENGLYTFDYVGADGSVITETYQR